jgi:hypothetical protein
VVRVWEGRDGGFEEIANNGAYFNVEKGEQLMYVSPVICWDVV